MTVLLFVVCTCAYIRATTLAPGENGGKAQSWLDKSKVGMRGTGWKFARIGERLSPYVAIACCVMAVHLLFIR